MTTPKEALEAVLSFLDELAANAAPGKRQALNPITIGGSAKLYAEGLRASLQGEDAVERVELPLARAINDVLNAMVDAQEEMTTTKISARILGNGTVRAILATGLVAGEAAIAKLVAETGSRDVVDLKDMALVGHSTMAAIEAVVTSDGPFKGWSPAEDPAEIITDLFGALMNDTARPDETAIRADEREKYAKLIEPKRPRPCDCDHCDCHNEGDTEAVAAWDADTAAAAAIRSGGAK